MSEPIRIGLVGCGRIARVHAHAYRRVARGRIVACADVERARATALADEFDYEVVADFHALLARDDLDAVLIATPNHLHADQTVAALAVGKHVFCQKPIALTVEDADRVVAAAAAGDRVLQHGFMLRFTPPVPRLKDALLEGALGTPIALRAAVFGWEPVHDWFFAKEHGGGVILDTLIHFADLVLWLLGDVDHVSAHGGAYVLEGAKRHGSPDNAIVTLHHHAGAISSLYVTWTAGHGDFSLELYGSEGSYEIDLIERQGARIFRRTPHEASGLPSGWSFPDLVWSYGYSGEQQYFVDRLLGLEDGSRAASAEDARAALELMLRAQHALDTTTVGMPA
jgi:myo-inositol 2-dehydrogenase/D-chiro-inositol 1-dehydrogenase